MAESQFCQQNYGIWTAFSFLFKFTYHNFYIKCPSPINFPSNTKNYLEMPFSLKHLCSNKSFSWCPPHHPELWGSGGRVDGDFLVLKNFLWWVGGLTNIVCEGRWRISFKNLNCILVLPFSQFSKILHLCNPDYAFTSVWLYRSIKFPKFEHAKSNLCTWFFSNTLSMMTFWHNLNHGGSYHLCNLSLWVSIY